jgi:hypothetical protein
VQHCRVEVSTVGPDERTGLIVQDDGPELRWVAQWTEQRAMKDRLKIDVLLGTVGELHGERGGAQKMKAGDPMDGMPHDLPEWFDLDRRPAGLQEIPVVLQLRPVDLRPGLDEPLLRLRQAAPKALECVHGEDRGVFLVVRMEMRAVM